MTTKNISIQYQSNGDHHLCEKVLRSLPDWFGIEESLIDYVEKSKSLPMLIALNDGSPIGFLSLMNHGKHTAEIYVMGVFPEFRDKGIGRLLVQETEKHIAQKEVKYLQVKTVSSAREDEFYKKTRLFYENCGFKQLEIFPDLWDKSNPCLLLIKNVDSYYKLRKLHAVYMFVDDVKKTSSWYSDLMGAPLSISEDRFAQIIIGNNELCFHQADKKSPTSTGGTVGYWGVDNLRDTADLFIERGASLYRGPIKIPDSKEGICQIKDPFGNIIGLQGFYNE